jgi:hypothetical protein
MAGLIAKFVFHAGLDRARARRDHGRHLNEEKNDRLRSLRQIHPPSHPRETTISKCWRPLCTMNPT